MTTQIGDISIGMTVKEALDHLRPDLEDTETLSRIFVLDEQDHLVGKLRLRDLTFNPWQTPVRDIMQPVEHTVLAGTDQEEASTAVLKYDMLALPVVDNENRLLGVITSDDAMEILSEESTEDIEKQAGLTGEQSEESYLNTGVTTHFSRRVIWLVGLALLSIAAGAVMFRFEETLHGIPLLMLFLPMIIAAGGNSGGQASTVAIRAMALNELDARDALRVAWKELRLGAMLGLILGITIAAVAILILPLFHPEVSPQISFLRFGLAVAVALAVQVTSSTLIGSLLPLGARAIHLDPAVIAAPAVTTVVDVSGMMIYLLVATSMLGLST
jgi:magnesium transporter